MLYLYVYIYIYIYIYIFIFIYLFIYLFIYYVCSSSPCSERPLRHLENDPSLQGVWGRTSSADGFCLRATRFARSTARSGASCSGQEGGGNKYAGMRPAALWQVTCERQESLQNIVCLFRVVHFNIEISPQHFASSLGCLFQRLQSLKRRACSRAFRRTGFRRTT